MIKILDDALLRSLAYALPPRRTYQPRPTPAPTTIIQPARAQAAPKHYLITVTDYGEGGVVCHVTV
jgi:hypothetical protein